eukprot:5382905-Prymnesium_polylepis.1
MRVVAPRSLRTRKPAPTHTARGIARTPLRSLSLQSTTPLVLRHTQHRIAKLLPDGVNGTLALVIRLRIDAIGQKHRDEAALRVGAEHGAC